MAESELKALVERAQSGDRLATDELFRRISSSVRATAQLMLGPQLRGYLDSDDVVQEALAAALVGLSEFRYRDEAGLVQWLATITGNRVRALANWHHAAKRDRRAEIVLPSDQGLPSTRTPPSQQVARRERDVLVREAVATLKADHRDVLVLITYLGASWESASERLGRSVAATRMLHRRATMELGRTLRRHGIVQPPSVRP